ncbi:hypothetical protein MMC17_001202 [Xylographa soralifera]|nr:hypothetical protein [Xylographa soralifera]
MERSTTSRGRSKVRVRTSIDGIEGATTDILLAAAISTLPMLGLSAALLGIVFANQVHPMSLSSTSKDENGFPANNISYSSSVYYVAFSATSFTAVASWASTAGTLLPGFFMALLWYRSALLFGRWSQSGDIAELPTPYQLNLFLAMKGGGFQAMWDWITYSLSRRQSNQSPMLRMAGVVLLTATLLGWLIAASDTWLHVTTIAVNIDQISSASFTLLNYSRALPFNCGHGVTATCTIDVIETVGPYLVNGYEVYRTLGNQSTINQILSTTVNDQRFSYIADPNQAENIDFIATTIASQSNCNLITDKCVNDTGGSSFNCSTLFNSQTHFPARSDGGGTGYTSSVSSNMNTVYLGYFANSSWTIPLNYTPGLQNISNPFYTIALAQIDSTEQGGEGLINQTQSMEDGGEGAFKQFFLGCETSFFNFTYTSVGGTIVSANTTLINNPLLVSALIEVEQSGYCDAQIVSGAFFAWFQNGSQITDIFAEQYDTTFLAPAASVINSVPTIAQQVRESILVTRVPKAALFGLTATLLLSAMFGLAMTITALISRPSAWRDVQARLSILGLTSARFEMLGTAAEPVKQLKNVYEENNGSGKGSRVGMLKSDAGGWTYVSWAGDSGYENADLDEDGVPLLALGKNQSRNHALAASDMGRTPNAENVQEEVVGERDVLVEHTMEDPDERSF